MKFSLEAFHDPPTDQKVPHLFSGENLEEPSALTDPEMKYLFLNQLSHLR